uniref:Uncharacterized protein n=1 Tax=Salix viminalis TaxID=40686 RepID=A0A6N2NEI0_SALVM
MKSRRFGSQGRLAYFLGRVLKCGSELTGWVRKQLASSLSFCLEWECRHGIAIAGNEKARKSSMPKGMILVVPNLIPTQLSRLPLLTLKASHVDQAEAWST